MFNYASVGNATPYSCFFDVQCLFHNVVPVAFTTTCTVFITGFARILQTTCEFSSVQTFQVKGGISLSNAHFGKRLSSRLLRKSGHLLYVTVNEIRRPCRSC